MSDVRAAEALYEYVRAMGFHGPDAKPWDERSTNHQELWIEAVRVVDSARSQRVGWIDDGNLFHLRSNLFTDRGEPLIIVDGSPPDLSRHLAAMMEKIEAVDIGPDGSSARVQRRMNRPKHKKLMKGRP